MLLIGWVYAITEASIFAPVRIFIAEHLGRIAEAGIYCPACTGFWIGAVLGHAGLWPHDSGWAPGESAFAAMAVAATWNKLLGGNAAWQIERGDSDEGSDHDATQSSEAREES
jgi:hypothetical protein